METLIKTALRRHPQIVALLDRVPPPFRRTLMGRLFGEPEPVVNDWRTIFKPVEYTFHEGWHLRAVLLLSGVLTAAAVTEISLVAGWWATGGALFVVAAIAAALFWPLGDKPTTIWSSASARLPFLPIAFVLPFIALSMLWDGIKDREQRTLIAVGSLGVVAGVVVSAFLIGVPVLATLALMRLPRVAPLPLAGAAAITAGVIAMAGASWWRGRRLERAARNPLHGLLERRLHSSAPRVQLEDNRLEQRVQF